MSISGLKQNPGFSFVELLITLLILAVLVTLSVLTLAPFRRSVKTDDAAGAVFTLMRQARILAVTRRQFYTVVINTSSLNQVIPINNSTKSIRFAAQSVSLVDMGRIAPQDDEELVLTKRLPLDVKVNAATGLPASTAFPQPEQSFSIFNFSGATPSGAFVCYFDPAGRAVNKADGTGTQEYRIFYFSSSDVDVNKSATLLRAITLYGATGGLKFWRYSLTPTPAKWEGK
jgi:prepilin-type N-terminal cleavage/methylation domain-containing protein